MSLRRPLCTAAAVALAGGALAGGASAATLSFGSTLKATPTLDTANGNLLNNGQQTGSQKTILPAPHAAEDLNVWNTAPGSGAKAAGQVLSIQVKGCAIKDATAPSQRSQGTPVNTLVFVTLHGSGGAWKGTGPPAAGFTLPFCSSAGNGTNHAPDTASGRVSTSTVTTFHPIHMCINRGDVVAFHTIGGFIPSSGGRGPWYAQGVPFEVLAPAPGSATASYVGFAGVFGPARGTGQSGYGVESGQQLMLRATVGTRGDAYGLCPGGKADEPPKANTVICTYGKAYDGHRKCGAGAAGAAAAVTRRRTGVFAPGLAFTAV